MQLDLLAREIRCRLRFLAISYLYSPVVEMRKINRFLR